MNEVTVIIPVYNSEQYIERTLKSLINQTYKDFDVLLINDGSKDGSKEIIEEYTNKYKNIKLINQDNMGVSKTRNKAIKTVKTKYIMFIDDDDYIDKDYIYTFVNKIKQTDADIVIGGYRRVNIDKKILFKQGLKETNWSKYIVLAPWAKIYKREFLIKNNIEFLDYPIGEDVYFNLVAFSKKPKCVIIDYIGYNWFFNTKSVSNTSQRGLNDKTDITFLLEKILSKYESIDELLKYYINRYFIWYMLFSGKKSSRDKFMEHYEKNRNWLRENNINNLISPFSSKLKGESVKNRLIVFIFLFIEKIHCVKLFSKIYCKGEEK